MELQIKRMGINGEGIAYIDRKPVFIDGALPEEVVEADITLDKPNYSRAALKQVVTPSKDRVKPACGLAEKCGGCPLMCLRYPAQLKYKKELLAEALYKYGNVKRNLIRDVRQSEYITGYRNACKMPMQMSHGELTAGMYAAGTNHYRPVRDCLIHHPDLEDARREVLKVLNAHHAKAFEEKSRYGFRNLIMRRTDDGIQVLFVTGKGRMHDDLVADIMKIPNIVSLYHSVLLDPKGVEMIGNTVTLLAGRETADIKVADITLSLSPEAFFQLNTEQAEQLYTTAVSKIDPCDTIVEAYCGVGAISLLAAKKAQRIIGIESVQKAVDNAVMNAEKNNIRNVEFLCADASVGLYRAARGGLPDCLIADPPRSGMDDKMLAAIADVLPKKIIYISCNPATLGKNLKELKHNYHVVTVIPFDMFPHTPLIESITVLERG